MKRDEERELLTRVAWMYHIGGMSQKKIAEDLGFTRIKVTRLLKQAVESGIVHVSIDTAYFSFFALEQELMLASGLRWCVVIPTVPNLNEALARGLAHLCNEIIGLRGSVGVGLSRSLSLTHFYLDKHKCHVSSVVSICGATMPHLSLKLIDPGFRIADSLGAEFYTIWAPLIVSSEADGNMLKRDYYISMVMEMARNVDYALVGIGNVEDSQLIDSGYITDEDYKSILASGATGEILGHYFALNGEPRRTVINDRLIAVDFPMKCPVLAAAGGSAKTRALRSGCVQGLVTDEKTAEAVLKMLHGAG
jgi:DNA-binding transcriptional regulator LsrR (DeoR family)